MKLKRARARAQVDADKRKRFEAEIAEDPGLRGIIIPMARACVRACVLCACARSKRASHHHPDGAHACVCVLCARALCCVRALYVVSASHHHAEGADA